MGKQIGEPVKIVVEEILKSRPHPEQGFRAALGLLRLGKTMGEERLRNACQFAIALGSPKYRSVRAILENGQDRRSHTTDDKCQVLPVHQNIRGSKYYQRKEEGDNAIAANHQHLRETTTD